MKRRDFLKIIAVGAVGAVVPLPGLNPHPRAQVALINRANPDKKLGVLGPSMPSYCLEVVYENKNIETVTLCGVSRQSVESIVAGHTSVHDLIKSRQDQDQQL